MIGVSFHQVYKTRHAICTIIREKKKKELRQVRRMIQE